MRDLLKVMWRVTPEWAQMTFVAGCMLDVLIVLWTS
jgi:hypothetical protein